jgi:hypothetical protein
MENIYTKFEAAFNNSEFSTGNININLMALGIATLATGLHITLLLAMFSK